jgi:hypothetical protein
MSKKILATAVPAIARPHPSPGGGEITFTLAEASEVDATFGQWQQQGLTFAQAPSDMDFGRTWSRLTPAVTVFAFLRRQAFESGRLSVGRKRRSLSPALGLGPSLRPK